jgi:hypothetical protein
MGLVVSIFAYLCGVTILVVTLMVWFGALLYPPDQTPIAQQTTTAAAKPHATQAEQVSSAGNEQSGAPGAKEVAADISNTNTARPPHVRRLVRQVRAKDWLHQQEPKVFGYAEEPSASFLYDRFQ